MPIATTRLTPERVERLERKWREAVQRGETIARDRIERNACVSPRTSWTVKPTCGASCRARWTGSSRTSYFSLARTFGDISETFRRKMNANDLGGEIDGEEVRLIEPPKAVRLYGENRRE